MHVNRISRVFKQFAVAPFAFAECLGGLSLFGDVARHAANDGLSEALGAEGIVVFPDTPLAGTGLHDHEPAGGAILLEPRHIFRKLIAEFRSQYIAYVCLSHERFQIISE